MAHQARRRRLPTPLVLEHLDREVGHKVGQATGQVREDDLFVGVTSDANVDRANEVVVAKSPEVFIPELQHSFQGRSLPQTLVQVSDHVSGSRLEQRLSGEGAERQDRQHQEERQDASEQSIHEIRFTGSRGGARREGRCARSRWENSLNIDEKVGENGDDDSEKEEDEEGIHPRQEDRTQARDTLANTVRPSE